MKKLWIGCLGLGLFLTGADQTAANAQEPKPAPPAPAVKPPAKTEGTKPAPAAPPAAKPPAAPPAAKPPVIVTPAPPVIVTPTPPRPAPLPPIAPPPAVVAALNRTTSYGQPLSSWVSGLKDNDPGRRVKALYAIARTGADARAAVPQMLKELQDERDLSVRRAYVWALQQIDPAAAAVAGGR